jgi:type IV pilus assembly protein PilN
MKLNINLATHPYEDARRFYLQWLPLLLGLLALAILLSVKAYASFQDRREVVRQLDAKNRQISQLQQERKQAETTLAQPANSGTRDQAVLLNQLFKRKSFSWTQVLADLETLMPRGVQVVSIKPDLSPAGQLQFTMDVASERRDAVIELVRRMEASAQFQGAQIRNEKHEGTDDNVLVMEIVANYVAAPRKAVR